MKRLVSGIAAAALLAAAVPAWPQATSPQTNTQQPGADGISKPGVPGKPGSKSGPAVSPSSGTSTAEPSTGAVRQQDTAGVKGMPGNKSGPAVKAPGETEKGGSSSTK